MDLDSPVLMGLGFGLIFAPSIQTATLGVKTSDSGVASAMVNISQQVGGSIGTALLSTIAVSTAGFAASHHGTPGLTAQAAVHGYTTAFT
jgi:Na+/phosphate symporter